MRSDVNLKDEDDDVGRQSNIQVRRGWVGEQRLRQDEDCKATKTVICCAKLYCFEKHGSARASLDLVLPSARIRLEVGVLLQGTIVVFRKKSGWMKSVVPLWEMFLGACGKEASAASLVARCYWRNDFNLFEFLEGPGGVNGEEEMSWV